MRNGITDEFDQQVQDQLKRRPRKRFNFDTPINQFNRLTRRPRDRV